MFPRGNGWDPSCKGYRQADDVSWVANVVRGCPRQVINADLGLLPESSVALNKAACHAIFLCPDITPPTALTCLSPKHFPKGVWR